MSENSQKKMFLQVLGGMRGMIGMLWETSLLDPEEVISRSSTSCCYVSIVYSLLSVHVHVMSKYEQNFRIKYCTMIYRRCTWNNFLRIYYVVGIYQIFLTQFLLVWWLHFLSFMIVSGVISILPYLNGWTHISPHCSFWM